MIFLHAFTLHNFPFYSQHGPLFSLRIFSKNGCLLLIDWLSLFFNEVAGLRPKTNNGERGMEGGGGVKTQESWANVLFECPLFETTDLFFRVIRHDSSVLLSQNFIYFKKPIKVQIWWNFTWSVESLKLCTLIGYFCPNHVQFQLKKYRRDLSWHWRVIRFLKKNSLFVWKTTWETWWILTQAVKNL